MAHDLTQPLTTADLDGLFAGILAPYRHVVLAVSGGADSTALMHLLAEWAGATTSPPKLSIATIDHQLRAGSTAEAELAARMAAGLGLPHTTLAWTGDKPSSGIQAAARAARYALLRTHAAAIGADAVVLAHTQDDQAETVLMRLARGSGIDGLGGMEPVTAMDGMTLVRPLLGVPKSRLVATLQARGMTWSEDPSNQNTAFERVRWREAFAQLTHLGLTSDAVAESARRLRRASHALDAIVTHVMAPSSSIVTIDPLGFATIHWPRLLEQPCEIRLRVLTRLIERIGGAGVPVPLARLEAMTEDQDWRIPIGRTLGRVMFADDASSSDHINLLREPGHVPPPAAILTPGSACLFDGRCHVALSDQCQYAVRIAALGPDGLLHAVQLGATRPYAPRDALHALPSVRLGDDVVAVPHLGFAAAPFDAAWVTTRWLWH
jgi:tRNA(Ile)-lysidine synthase